MSDERPEYEIRENLYYVCLSAWFNSLTSLNSLLSIMVVSQVLLFALGVSLTSALTQCPTAENVYTGAAGSNYAICGATDLQGATVSITPGVPSAAACAAICDKNAQCNRAVYDNQNADCHIKSNNDNLNWVDNGRFNVIRLTTLKQCPNAETAYTGSTGAKYSVCAGTDLVGASLAIIAGATSATDCAAKCNNDGRCFKAIYDTQNGDCHIKSNNDNLNWVANGRFVRIRANNDLAEGTIISKCPFTTSAYTSPSGTKYQICPDTDIRGANAQGGANVADQAACARLCGTTTGCKAAVYDTVNKICYIKSMDADATLIWALNKQFDVIQNIPTYNPATQGSWSDFVRLPVVPVGAYVVPAFPQATRLLFFSAWGPATFGGPGGFTQFADYSFASGAVSARTVANTNHDMFCPGMSALEDGRIVISGGSDAQVTSLYDPATNAFTRGPDLKIPRGYQSSTTLSDGKVFTIGGCYSGGITGQDAGVPYKNGEVYDPVANTWTILPGAQVQPMLTTDAEGPWRTDNHGWLFGWKNGSVFQAGPSPKQHWYGTANGGSVAEAGTRPGADDQMCGVNVMYDVGKILTVGGESYSTTYPYHTDISSGSTDYTNSDAVAMAHITTITNVGAPSMIERVADMSKPRGFANGVVLPDGTVLVTGGQKRSMVFTDDGGVVAAELFKPSTKTWTKMAPEAVPRNYHSESLLLPDARVWSGGGGLCYAGGRGNDGGECNLDSLTTSILIENSRWLQQASRPCRWSDLQSTVSIQDRRYFGNSTCNLKCFGYCSKGRQHHHGNYGRQQRCDLLVGSHGLCNTFNQYRSTPRTGNCNKGWHKVHYRAAKRQRHLDPWSLLLVCFEQCGCAVCCEDCSHHALRIAFEETLRETCASPKRRACS